MELEFIKNAQGQQIATGDGAKFTLILNPLDKVWTVKQDAKVIHKGLKGLATAQAAAQAVEDSLTEDDDDDTEEEEEEAAPAPKKKVTAKVVPVPVKVSAKIAAPAKVSAKVVPAAPVKTKRVKPFPEFDVWAETNVELLPVPKSGAKKAGIELQNVNTTKGAKLKHGRLRASYNRENGIAAPVKEVSARVARVPKEKVEKVLLTPGERFGGKFGGESFHDFGEVPTMFEYLMAQLQNARCSKAYNIVHSRLHPFSEAAQGSYLNSVIRQYVGEEKLFEHMQELDASGETYKVPKGFTFDYYNAKGVPAELVGEAEEGYSVLEGHTFDGFGKLSLGAGVTLPVKLNTRAATTATRTATKKK